MMMSWNEFPLSTLGFEMKFFWILFWPLVLELGLRINSEKSLKADLTSYRLDIPYKINPDLPQHLKLPWKRLPGQLRIVVLGSSNTIGMGVPYSQSMIEIMRKNLNDLYPGIQVINLSRVVHSALDMEQLAVRYVDLFNPTHILLSLSPNFAAMTEMNLHPYSACSNFPFLYQSIYQALKKSRLLYLIYDKAFRYQHLLAFEGIHPFWNKYSLCAKDKFASIKKHFDKNHTPLLAFYLKKRRGKDCRNKKSRSLL